MDDKKNEDIKDLGSDGINDELKNDKKIEDGEAVSPPPLSPEISGKNLWLREMWEWTQAIVIAVVLGIVIKTFLFTLVLVKGASMVPTLDDGDRLFVYRLFYKPKAEDVIVFTPPNDPAHPYIKRVIATEGQTVDIDFSAHEVYVDGKLLEEPYIFEPTERSGDLSYPIEVLPGTVFVMGDNRNDSRDSRRSEIGLVDVKTILGKASFRWWPLNKISGL